MRAWDDLVVFGVGHSNRPIEELVALLWENGVVTLADIRHHPGSRKNPQFNPGPLAESLTAAGIRYAPIPELGGRRRPRADSPNGGWRSDSFRGYADHLGTAEFARGLARLRALASEGPLAMMCAEAVPWRCHRALLADLLVARGCPVRQIFGPGQTRPHRMTPFARVVGDRVIYPPEPSRPEEHPG
jgi:uncharacterized protein (DUF488 family)